MILPLEKQVPTRETCERLQEDNFNGGTLLWWAPQQTPEVDWEWRVSTSPTGGVGIPAPTAAEFGALLPTHLKGQYTFDVWRLNDAWIVRYVKSTECGEEDLVKAQAGTEAEARALLWLDLHEKDLLPDAAYGA